MNFPDFSKVPDGWMVLGELQILYNLGLNNKGNLFEVGPWIGRSTSAMAMGLAEKGEPTNFHVVDFGICGVKDWMRRFGKAPWGYGDINEQIKLTEVVCHRGGSPADLVQNLVDQDLYKYITCLSLCDICDLSLNQKFNSVFIDCIHDDEELEKNLIQVKRFLDNEFILIVDDTHNQERANKISQVLNTKHWLSNTKVNYSKLGVFWTPTEEKRAQKIINI